MSSRVRVAAAAFIIIHSVLKKKRKPPRWWMREMYRHRRNHSTNMIRELTFEGDNEPFRNFTRMSRMDFEHLLSLIGPEIKKQDTAMREAIPPHHKLMMTLRFLATGDSYSSLQYMFKVSKQSISRFVPVVCDAIVQALKDYIEVPRAESEWLDISQKFEEKWNYPHCVGAMDGKHIQIIAPPHSGAEYRNYKEFFSIVLFVVVDADYNFIYVDVGCKGRISDGGVFRHSNLYRELENETLNIPPPKILQIPYDVQVPYVILGDNAFALNEYTMKPFAGNNYIKGSLERIYNYRHSRARRVVENVFGIIASVFRVLRKPITIDTNNAISVVMAITHLHNFMRKRNHTREYNCPIGTFDREENGEFIPGTFRNDEPLQSLSSLPHIPRRSTNHIKEIRMHIARHFITNAELPWQYNLN